ncbi:unnamed protein product [Phaedon cochleariae]|uniref:Uncharacterized protein n=1 Tax=Phaedon cochleariae TaxID=80249 RepID=A0A9P0DAK5_PHACE|nr:unnamed protein product [Phaedon cochleariae]
MSTKRRCWVPTCLNPDLDPKKKFFTLPENAQAREVWLALSGKPIESISTEIFFCQDHFSTQDIIRMDENKQYQNRHKILPSNYMPDRMCGTCMSLIPPEQSFHIVSSKFPSEMPPVVKEILNFMVPSEPEPLHQIFTFCMKDLKLPRDPPPVACNECYINAWVYFVFKMTCIEVEKDLKADMSWENYGKKVLCRSCPQTMGTNFISLLSSPNMANLLRNMFIGDCPPPEIVPLQVCITCYNVLERIEIFSKNCLEADEKMKRHIALKKKFDRSDSNIPSSSTFFTRSSNTRTSGIIIQSERGPMLGFPVDKVTEKIKIENIGSSRSSKTLLAQLMLEHGQSLKTDLYQQDVWSVICDKMQQQGVGCNVPGLMNVWKKMVQDTKIKFDTKQPIGTCDKLVMQFHKAMQNIHTMKSLMTPSTAVSADPPDLVSSTLEDKEKKLRSESPEKQIPVLVDESRPFTKSKNKKKPIDVPTKISAWTDENKLEFLDIFEKEYIQYTAKIEDMGKRRPWKTICINIASGGYYTIKDESFFHRLWNNLKSRAEEDTRNKPSPLNKKVLSFLRMDNIIYSGKPIPYTNEEKRQLIRLCDKHMPLIGGKWPAPQEYWDAVAKDFAAVNPLHDAESVKRGHRNLRMKLRSRINGVHDEIDKLMIEHLSGHPGNYLERYGYSGPLGKKKKSVKVVAAAVAAVAGNGSTDKLASPKIDSNRQLSINLSLNTDKIKDPEPKINAPEPKINAPQPKIKDPEPKTKDPEPKTKKPGKRGRTSPFNRTKMIDDLEAMYEATPKQKIIALDKNVWTTMLKELWEKDGSVVNFNTVLYYWRMAKGDVAKSKMDASPMQAQVRRLLQKHDEIMKSAPYKAVPAVEGEVASAAVNQPTTSTQLRTVRKGKLGRPSKAGAGRPSKAGAGRPPTMTYMEKYTFVNDVIREYDALTERQDPSIFSRSPWTAVIQRVVEKNPNMNFQRAYSLWSRFRVSARSHERDGRDPFDVQIWNLLERHQEMMKERKMWNPMSPMEACDSNETVVVTRVAEVTETEVTETVVTETVVTETEPPVTPNKKRPSDGQETVDSKKTKYTLMDPAAFSKLEPHQHDEILSLLAATYQRMLEANESDLSWKNVIVRIYKNGGYRDITQKDFICLFNRMRYYLSVHKNSGELTAFDGKLKALLKKSVADRQARSVRRSAEKKHHPVKYEKDYAYCPGRKVAGGEDGGKAKEDGSGSNLDVSRRRKSASHVMFNLDEFYDSEVTEQMLLPSKKQMTWSREEKLALISVVKAQGSAVFQLSKSNKVWETIVREFETLGYRRSPAAVQWYWNRMRKNAEMAWAKQIEPTDIDEMLIEFMTTAIREKTTPENAEASSSDDSRDKPVEDDEVVDLTYDYVSFDDIERLSMQTANGRVKNIKSEHRDEEADANASCTSADDTTITNAEDVNFVLAKVEGGAQYDMDDEDIEDSQPEFVTAEQIGLGEENATVAVHREDREEEVEKDVVEHRGEDPLSHIEYTYEDEDIAVEGEESVFEENGAEHVSAVAIAEATGVLVRN